MALLQRLTEEELALVEVVEDPIFFGEFFRTIRDGETDKNLHLPVKWSYRDYQRQFLSDTSEFILYTGGRAIGKCSPRNAKILVAGHGYKTLGELAEQRSFITYALTPDMTVEQRRAVCVPDLITEAYTVITESGHKFVGTEVHPILTPEGYRLIKDLQVGDYAAVVTQLPHDSNNKALRWHELRYLGYIILNSPFSAELPFKARYAKIGKEIEIIADRMHVNWHKTVNGVYTLPRKKGPFQHPANSLLKELGIDRQSRYFALGIPDIIKEECLENIQIFLEALFAQHASINSRSVKIKTHTDRFAYDLQELLLRFGIESKITLGELTKANKVSTGKYYTSTLELLDYRAVYRFLNKFSLPGIGVDRLQLPPASSDATDFMRYDRITSITKSHRATNTYAVHVYECNNYIGDNFYVHNTVVLEDKIIHEIVNSDIEFPVTPEMLLTTPNRAQLTPLQGKLIQRFTSGKFLKDYLRNNINRQDGILTFPVKPRPFVFYNRIAGSKGENNLVGLHIPRIRGDEMQLFNLNAWTQMQPTFNSLI